MSTEFITPLFFLHLDNQDGFLTDEEGQVFVGRNAAVFEAARAVGATLTEDLRDGTTETSIRVEIKDAAHDPVSTVIVDRMVAR